MTSRQQTHIDRFKQGDELLYPKSFLERTPVKDDTKLYFDEFCDGTVYVKWESGWVATIDPAYFLRYIDHAAYNIESFTMEDVYKRYPIGSVVQCLVDPDDKITITSDTQILTVFGQYIDIMNDEDELCVCIYDKDKWAEIVSTDKTPDNTIQFPQVMMCWDNGSDKHKECLVIGMFDGRYIAVDKDILDEKYYYYYTQEVDFFINAMSLDDYRDRERMKELDNILVKAGKKAVELDELIAKHNKLVAELFKTKIK